MADKFHSDTREKVETISYAPNYQDTGDLESGTYAIVPTSRPAIGSAQYSQSLTVLKPGDSRIIVKQIGARLNVNIAGLGSATTVNCAVRVDADDADHELFNESWSSTGSKLAATRLTSGTLFDLLTDGQAHTFYFLFWADADNQATIDVVELWEGVGTNQDSGTPDEIIRINHDGYLSLLVAIYKIGSGSNYASLTIAENRDDAYQEVTASVAKLSEMNLLASNVCVCGRSGVDTDLAYMRRIYLTLRSAQ